MAEADFRALSESVGYEQSDKWESDEKQAQQLRHEDISAMDIFDVNDADGMYHGRNTCIS